MPQNKYQNPKVIHCVTICMHLQWKYTTWCTILLFWMLDCVTCPTWDIAPLLPHKCPVNIDILIRKTLFDFHTRVKLQFLTIPCDLQTFLDVLFWFPQWIQEQRLFLLWVDHLESVYLTVFRWFLSMRQVWYRLFLKFKKPLLPLKSSGGVDCWFPELFHNSLGSSVNNNEKKHKDFFISRTKHV